MEKLFFLFSILSLFSCGNKRLDTYGEVRKQYADYVINHNESSLRKSYKDLIKNEDFKNNGITTKNIIVVVPILIKMGKYDQLIELLNNCSILPDYQKNFYLNLSKALKYRCKNIGKSNLFINQNLNLIKNQIIENQNDSILYFDYYFTKLYVSDLTSILSEIDSLKNTEKMFTDDFYDNILKEHVSEMNNQIEKCK